MPSPIDEALGRLRVELAELERLARTTSDAEWVKRCVEDAVAAHPSPTRDEVIALGRTSVERMATAVAGASDAALERVAFVYAGHERSIRWVIGTLAVQHARGHRESIAAAIS